MPNFVDCWNSLKAKGYKHADGSEVLNDHDRASIEARIQEHLRTGLDPIEAAKASVKSHLDEAHTQLQSVYDQVGEHVANIEAAKVTEEPRGFPESQEPFPSITRSAEQQRRGGVESPKIREAISLDELRLMRERKELELQNEIAKRAGGGTHPAVDERISQIETELTDIANRELQQRGGGQAKPTEGGTGEEVQKGQEGREAVLATERVQPPAVPPESPEALGEALKERPRSAGVANRVLQERAARGEIPQAPEAGQGHLTEDIINKSRQDYTPERALAAAENIKNGSTNEADAGQIRIHEENLTRVARDAEKALDADPKNPVLQQAYNAAKDNLSKWHNETVQPMKTQWSNIGKSMQGATDIDTGSYIGLQKLAWDTAKRDFTPQEEPVMRAAAKRSDQATKEVQAAIARAEDHVQKVLKPSRYMDLNQLRESLAEKLKNITC